MAIVMKNEIKYEHYVEPKTNRHFINGIPSVLHCHHYTALYTQLAIDAGETELLKECARESFRKMLNHYYDNNPQINTIESKIDLGCQYYSLVGLGKMQVNYLGDEGGEVQLSSSHTDNGWIKKWGKYDKPVNYITAGFVEALFEVVLDYDEKTFETREEQSIVMGQSNSIFKVIRR